MGLYMLWVYICYGFIFYGYVQQSIDSPAPVIKQYISAIISLVGLEVQCNSALLIHLIEDLEAPDSESAVSADGYEL